MDINVIKTVKNGVDFHAWIEASSEFLSPPVCNRLLYANKLKVMIVGGPNIRNDYHLEEGEEFFYQIKGDMLLKVIEQGVHKDIVIKEGEMFVIPSNIPHSPNRFANTIGVVIERERLINEIDGLIWFNDKPEKIYQEFFHCIDLGTQLKPVIERYHASDTYKTRNPDPNTQITELPIAIDKETTLATPIHFQTWLQSVKSMQGETDIALYRSHEFHVHLFAAHQHNLTIDYKADNYEKFFYQFDGETELSYASEQVKLFKNYVYLINDNVPHTVTFKPGAVCLVIKMIPKHVKSTTTSHT